MEKKNAGKINLSTILLIIAVIVIIVMEIFICKLNNDKTAEIQKSTRLQTQVNSLNETATSLQEKINSISDTINSNSSTQNQTTNNSSANTENTADSQNSSKVDSKYSKEYIKVLDQINADFPNNNITCDLIYFNNDNTPDLVVSNLGYWTSLYIFKDGIIHNPIDKWAYGAGGNYGYKYQERKGTVLNNNSDYAGAIINTTIYLLNSSNTFDALTVTKRGTFSENDDIASINNALASYGGYYYNNQKITEQEYNNKLKAFSVNINDNNSKELNGNTSILELKKQLQN